MQNILTTKKLNAILLILNLTKMVGIKWGDNLKISTKGRYGLKAMIDLALNSNGNSVSLKNIAERQSIPEAYLEQLIPYLKKASLVESVRGANGGYLLAKQPKDITVGEILKALEGSMALVGCVDNSISCGEKSECISRIVWEKIQVGINQAIDNFTLEALIEEFKNNKNREMQL